MSLPRLFYMAKVITEYQADQTSITLQAVGAFIHRGNRYGGNQWPLFMPDHEAGASSHQDRAKVEAKDVLVVEDEPYLCDLIADVLEAEGHNTRKASNGLEALERLREQRPQIILLDLMMPVMDGWEFLATLRSHPQWDGIPVVIITAVYDVARTKRDTGARAVITKPFDIDQLAEAVRIYADS